MTAAATAGARLIAVQQRACSRCSERCRFCRAALCRTGRRGCSQLATSAPSSTPSSLWLGPRLFLGGLLHPHFVHSCCFLSR